MRYKIVLVFYYVFFILLANAGVVHAQENWDKYQPRTIKQLIELNAKTAASRETRDARVQLLFTSDFPSLVKVTYTGEKRAIPAKKKEFIAAWGKSRQLRQEIIDLFEEELLFKEESTEYWLPVQKQVVPYFAEELKKGDAVELYLMLAGARTEDGVTDWVFLVNEFKK